MCIAYKRPDRETQGIGLHRSTNTFSNFFVAFSPSRILGTGEHVCFPSTQWVHFGGAEERSMVIPSTAPLHAMSTMDRTLQCLSQRCQVSTSGIRDAYRVEGLQGTGVTEAEVRRREYKL